MEKLILLLLNQNGHPLVYRHVQDVQLHNVAKHLESKLFNWCIYALKDPQA